MCSVLLGPYRSYLCEQVVLSKTVTVFMNIPTNANVAHAPLHLKDEHLFVIPFCFVQTCGNQISPNQSTCSFFTRGCFIPLSNAF